MSNRVTEQYKTIEKYERGPLILKELETIMGVSQS